MYDASTRREALALISAGLSHREVSRRTGISRAALRDWQRTPAPSRAECPRCQGASLTPAAYGGLLGFYLGDGHLARAPRYWALRVSCDATFPGVIRDVETQLTLVRPGMTTFRVRAPGTVVVQAHWKHWPCLFPQHGPGRKHERPNVLEGWQREIVEEHPGPFLRGLFHSDGSRSNNWATRLVAGEPKRYDYPRWQFKNASGDIRHLCCWALDLVDVAWRQSGPRTISVSRREAVAALDALIGVKS